MILLITFIACTTFMLGYIHGRHTANKDWQMILGRPTKELHSLVNRNFEWAFWSKVKKEANTKQTIDNQ